MPILFHHTCYEPNLHDESLVEDLHRFQTPEEIALQMPNRATSLRSHSMDVLVCTFFVNQQSLQVLDLCQAATEACHSTHGICLPRNQLMERIFQIFEMLDAKIASEFQVQEEGQSRGTESPERGPFSTRKTARLHDLRLLSSDWCS